nr:putative ribonuclease H-like domain-containing protein [Tanacetum cinerariifolium]
RAPWVPTVNRNFPLVNRKFSTSDKNFPTVNKKFSTASRKFPTGSTKGPTADTGMKRKAGSSQNHIDDKGYWDSGCSRHITGNISYLSDYEPFDGGYVSFGQGGCKITRKGTIKTGKLEFENVYFVKDLKFNLFSVSQICDNKNSVLFTDSECIVLGRDFKLLDDANILLRTPRQHNIYSIDLNNIVSHRDLTCLVAKASADECTKVDASKDVKKDVSSLRYIVLPNWGHEEKLGLLQVNLKTLTVETPIPTASLPIPTVCFSDSQEPSSATRLISKRVTNQEEIPSLENILTFTNQFEDILGDTSNSKESDGVEADVSYMETTIIASPTPTLRIHRDHPKSQIIGPMDNLIQTRNKSKESLVDCPKGVRPIETKWVLKNKKDERGIVIRNKARLVAQGHTQEERIDYDEVFSPVARIKAIRLFLAYASFMGFIVYQMDVKSAFFYGTIDEEVYMMQPPRFQDPEYPARVYKVEKAMYGLHQAPKAWYGTLSKYLLSNGFQRGIIDQTLFIRREFEALMHEKFQMSAMGELNFFLGLQVLQKEGGIFLSQDKYVGDILKKFGYSDLQIPPWTRRILGEWMVLEKIGNSNPTATSTNLPADQLETLTVETPIPTVSSPVLTVCFTDSQEPSSETRLISKRVANQVETPSMDNILTLTNRFEDILGVTSNEDESNGVEVDVSNMEITLKIHRDHPKSQIIGHVDTSIQTRNKSKEVGEQKPKNISDALQDPSWVEATQEELL